VRIFYRVRQFWQALTSTPDRQDLEQARQVLSPSLLALFWRMQASEQKHGLAIMHQLHAQGETNPDLMVAILLHDVGKTRYPLNPWERVIIVLGRLLMPVQVARWGQASPISWKRPFVVAEQHPAWGAELAEQAGASPLAVRLIRQHQDRPVLTSPLLKVESQLEIQLLQRLQLFDDHN